MMCRHAKTLLLGVLLHALLFGLLLLFPGCPFFEMLADVGVETNKTLGPTPTSQCYTTNSGTRCSSTVR